MVSYTKIDEKSAVWAGLMLAVDERLQRNNAAPDGENYRDHMGRSSWTCFLKTTSFVDVLGRTNSMIYVTPLRGFSEGGDNWGKMPITNHRSILYSMTPKLLSSIKEMYGVADDEWMIASSYTMEEPEFKVWKYIFESPYQLRNVASRDFDCYNNEDFEGQVKVALSGDYNGFFRSTMPFNYHRLWEIGFLLASRPSTFTNEIHYNITMIEEFDRYVQRHVLEGFIVAIHTDKTSHSRYMADTLRRWSNTRRRFTEIESGVLTVTDENRAKLFDSLNFAISCFVGQSTNAGLRENFSRNFMVQSSIDIFNRIYYGDVGEEGKLLLTEEYATHRNTQR